MFPSLRGKVDLAFSDPTKGGLEDCDLVFFATPHGVAMTNAPALVEAGVKVIDLAADFRLQNLLQWRKWYQMETRGPGVACRGGLWVARNVSRAHRKGANRWRSRLLRNGGATWFSAID